MTILIIPSTPISRKLTAHGYRNITSTSNKTKRIATRKYFIENGIRALPTDSIPHSKFLSLITDLRRGPKNPEIIMVVTTNPTANRNCIKIGK